MTEYEKDLEIAKKVMADGEMLYKKYKYYRNVSDIVEVLSIAVECDIPIKSLYKDGYSVRLNPSYAYFDFYFCHEYRLTNKSTGAKFDKSQWYIHFTCGGCGILNLCNDSQIAYKEEPQQIWKNFLEWIRSYNPIDWDNLNNEYVFSVRNGYRLYQDFKAKYDETREQMDNAVAKYKIEKLQAEIRRLNGED